MGHLGGRGRRLHARLDANLCSARRRRHSSRRRRRARRRGCRRCRRTSWRRSPRWRSPRCPWLSFERELVRRRSARSTTWAAVRPGHGEGSIVLCCVEPRCAARTARRDDCRGFHAERAQMHATIVDRRRRRRGRRRRRRGAGGGGGRRRGGRLGRRRARRFRCAARRGRRTRRCRRAPARPSRPGGPPPTSSTCSSSWASPARGSDTVLKRCAAVVAPAARGARLAARAPLTAVHGQVTQVHPLAQPQPRDASADVVKEYLAAWGADAVRAGAPQQRGARAGAHLLHAQYLHRESILVTDTVVARALEQGSSLMLEKTLRRSPRNSGGAEFSGAQFGAPSLNGARPAGRYDVEHVLSYARRFRERGCKVHRVRHVHHAAAQLGLPLEPDALASRSAGTLRSSRRRVAAPVPRQPAGDPRHAGDARRLRLDLRVRRQRRPVVRGDRASITRTRTHISVSSCFGRSIRASERARARRSRVHAPPRLGTDLVGVEPSLASRCAPSSSYVGLRSLASSLSRCTTLCTACFEQLLVAHAESAGADEPSSGLGAWSSSTSGSMSDLAPSSA